VCCNGFCCGGDKQVCCNEQCVYLHTSTNCGSCGNSCSSGSVCLLKPEANPPQRVCCPEECHFTGGLCCGGGQVCCGSGTSATCRPSC
jgi:hypothetical protein